MMKSNIQSALLLVLSTVVMLSCSKDENQPSTTVAGIRIQALNKSYSLPVNGTKSVSTVTAVSWDAARMVVSGLKFEAELKSLITHHDSVEFEYKWRGPEVVNLFDTTFTIGNITLQPGFYDEIEIKIEGLKRDAGTDPVFLLTGVYTNTNSEIIPISVRVYEDILFKTEKESVEITSADISVFSSVIQLYLDQLMMDISPEQLDNAILTDGELIISAQSNTDLYRIFMRNLGRDHHCEHGHGHGHGHGG